MMLEIGIDWPGKFTQGKPRGHWTRLARARDRAPRTRGAGRDTSTGLQGHSSPSMRHQACHGDGCRSAGTLLIPASELTPPTKAETELARNGRALLAPVWV